MDAVILGANFSGNVGDLCIFESVARWLVGRGTRDAVVYPYPLRYDPYVALRSVTPFRGVVRLEPPLRRMRGRVEVLTRRYRPLRWSVAGAYFSPVGRLFYAAGAKPEPWDASPRVVVLGGELDVPYSLLDSHAYLRDYGAKAGSMVYGPISLPPDRHFRSFLVRRFAEVPEVAARDPLSAETLVDMGIANVRMVPDTAFLGFEEGSYSSVGAPTGKVGLCLDRRWALRANAGGFVASFLGAASALGCEVVLVSTHVRDDAALLAKLMRWFPATQLALPRTPDELMALNRELDLVASDRLHGLLLGMIAGSVALPIATRAKVAGYCKYWRLDRYLTGTESEPELADTLADALAERTENLSRQRAFCAGARRQVDEYFSSRLQGAAV